MFAIKPSVDIRFLRREIRDHLPTIYQIFRYHAPHGFKPTITAGQDGEHKTGSKHYANLAADFRIWFMVANRQVFITDEKIAQIVADIRKFLGQDYDVIWHRKSHLHVEYDP